VIKISYNQTNQLFQVEFGGSNFMDILNEAKSLHLEYDVESKKFWYASKFKIKAFIDQVKTIENIIFVPNEQTIFDLIKPKLEIKKERLSLKSELITYGFIPGKPPYENYQELDVRRGFQTNRLAFWEEQGLGKTPITIYVTNHLIHYNRIDKILVLCPTDVLYNWYNDFMKFNSFNLNENDIYIADTNNRDPFSSDAKIIIMTYRSFLMLSDDAYKLSHKNKASKRYRTNDMNISAWGTNRCLICDESQRLKSFTARSFKALKIQKDYFEYRYILSGTPAPKDEMDYYSQMYLLDENIIGMDYEDFKYWLCKIGTRFSKYAIASIKKDKAIELQNMIKPYIIRRLSNETINLPELQIVRNYCQLNDKQLKIYQTVFKEVLNSLNETKELELKQKDNQLKKINNNNIKYLLSIKQHELRKQLPFIIQSLHNPNMMLNNEFVQIKPELYKLLNNWKFDDHSKLPVLDSLLENYIDDNNLKVIIWIYHPSTAEGLLEYYGKKYDPLIIHGQINKSNLNTAQIKNKIVNEFKSNTKHKLLIASALSIGIGVTINESTRSVWFERDYNFEHYYQPLKRNHRIGQTDTVISNLLLFRNTIEISQDQTIENRLDLNNNSFKEQKEFFNQDDLSKFFTGQII
jgi:SNF2 family DNA or RNA helicase